MKNILFIFLALCFSFSAFAQDLPYYGDLNYKPEVQTVLLYADGNQLNDPIVPLDDLTERLTLSFDVLGGDGDVLNYTFIHCTHDWQPTDIQRIKYASGFESDRIDDYCCYAFCDVYKFKDDIDTGVSFWEGSFNVS